MENQRKGQQYIINSPPAYFERLYKINCLPDHACLFRFNNVSHRVKISRKVFVKFRYIRFEVLKLNFKGASDVAPASGISHVKCKIGCYVIFTSQIQFSTVRSQSK